MKVYVAAHFPQQKIARAVGEHLKTLGHEVVSTWLGEVNDAPLTAAYRDVGDVQRADALLLLPVDQGGCGMWIEMGMALVLGKKVFVLGTNKRSVFHHMSNVRMIDNLEEIQ